MLERIVGITFLPAAVAAWSLIAGSLVVMRFALADELADIGTVD